MKFALAPLQESDMDELIEVQFHTFGDNEMSSAFFGGTGPKAKAKCKSEHLKAMREDPADVWLKITDTDTGKIVSASNWKVFPTYVLPEDHEIKADWHETEPANRAAGEMLVDYLGRRKVHMTHARVLLYILFVDPKYQRRGIGGMMMKWGCDLADQLFLPMWVESTHFGHGLYASYGFADVEEVDKRFGPFREAYTLMKREQKVKEVVLVERTKLVDVKN